MANSSVTEEFNDKDLLDRIRPLLQRDKVRLWEAPYTDTEHIPEASLESRRTVPVEYELCRRISFEVFAPKSEAPWTRLDPLSCICVDTHWRN